MADPRKCFSRILDKKNPKKYIPCPNKFYKYLTDKDGVKYPYCISCFNFKLNNSKMWQESKKKKKERQCNHNIDLNKRCERCEDFYLMKQLGNFLEKSRTKK